LHGVRNLHVEQLRRVVQPLQMVGKPEDRRAFLGLVAADSLEDSGAVVETVAADVDPGVCPVDELTVHPDLFGLAHLRTLLPSLKKSGWACPEILLHRAAVTPPRPRLPRAQAA